MHTKGSFQLNTGWTMMVLMHCQTLLYHRTKIKKKKKQNVAFSQPLPQSIVLPYVKKILISLMHHLLIFIKPIFKDRRRRSCSIIPKKKFGIYTSALGSEFRLFVSILVQLDAGRLHLLLMSQTVIIEATWTWSRW